MLVSCWERPFNVFGEISAQVFGCKLDNSKFSFTEKHVQMKCCFSKRYFPCRWIFPNRKKRTTFSSFSQKMFWARVPHVTGRADSLKPLIISFVKTWPNRLWQSFIPLGEWFSIEKNIVWAAGVFYHDLFMPFNLCNNINEKMNELPVIGSLRL